MTALSELGKLMNPPAHPLEADVEWGAVEAALSATLPQDYKDFIGMYGSGSINGFLTILNPAASDDRLNLRFRIDLGDACFRGDGLGKSFDRICLFKQGLPLKIGKLDKIAVNEPQLPDARPSQHLGMCAPERPTADKQNPRIE